jgi:hypothetical protein
MLRDACVTTPLCLRQQGTYRSTVFGCSRSARTTEHKKKKYRSAEGAFSGAIIAEAHKNYGIPAA